jgi:hypothetical protein
VGEFVRAIEAGRWCQERGSLMRAYAFGVLAEEGERRQLADDHLASCSPCRSYVRSLRGLSAALPPVALPVGAAGDGGAAGVMEQLRELLDGAGGPLLRLVEDAPARAAGAAMVAGGGATAGGGASAAAGGAAAKLVAVVVAVALAGGGAAAVVHGNGAPTNDATLTGAVQRPVAPAAATRAATSGPLAARRAGSGAASTERAKKPRRTKPARARRTTRPITIARAVPAATTPPAQTAPVANAPVATAPVATAPVATAPATTAPATPQAPGEFSFESG